MWVLQLKVSHQGKDVTSNTLGFVTRWEGREEYSIGWMDIGSITLRESHWMLDITLV